LAIKKAHLVKKIEQFEISMQGISDDETLTYMKYRLKDFVAELNSDVYTKIPLGDLQEPEAEKKPE
jgi:hypothetical protein